MQCAAAHLRNLGCKQRFRDAVKDHIGLEPDAPAEGFLRWCGNSGSRKTIAALLKEQN